MRFRVTGILRPGGRQTELTVDADDEQAARWQAVMQGVEPLYVDPADAPSAAEHPPVVDDEYEAQLQAARARRRRRRAYLYLVLGTLVLLFGLGGAAHTYYKAAAAGRGGSYAIYWAITLYGAYLLVRGVLQLPRRR